MALPRLRPHLEGLLQERSKQQHKEIAGKEKEEGQMRTSEEV